jgi:hypothetical protein
MMAADDLRDGHIPGPPYLTTEELRRDVSALREILQARLDGMDKAAVVLSETVNRTPTAIQTAIANVREVYDERFTSIAQQFRERDVRTEQSARAGKEALDAALLSAKELVAQQNDANTTKAEKTEQNFTKQIDNALDRIGEIKERIDRGEGSQQGQSGQRAESRLNLGTVISFGFLAVAVVTFVILYVAKR